MNENTKNIPEQGMLPIKDSKLAKNSDTEQTPMMAQFWEIKNSVPDCLLFYRMGDFYELFFDDAVRAAAILDITLTKRGQHQGKDIPMCGVPVHSHESYLHKLISQGVKIAICEQLEDPKEAKKRGSKSVVKRGIVRIVTPGTITEDNLLNARSHNYLCCLYEQKGMSAISWIDMSTGDFFVQNISPENILNVLHRIDAGEILLPEEQKTVFQEVIDEFPQRIMFLPLSHFDAKNANNTLCHFFECSNLSIFGDFGENEVTAAGCLLDYIKIMQINAMPHIRSLLSYQNQHFMEIDVAARINLEICDSPHGKKNSLLGILDHCRTAGGARLLKEWLNAPLFKLDAIIARHEGIASFQKFPKNDNFLEILNSIGDAERALNRLSLKRGSPRDMKIIADMLSASEEIKSLLANFYASAPEIIQTAFANLHNLFELKNTLLKALNETLPLQTRDGGFIRQGFSAQLDHFQNLALHNNRTILALEQKYRKQTNLDVIKIKKNNVLGFFIEIPSRHAQKLDTSFIHRQSTANTARFTTQELEESAREIMHASERALAVEIELFETLCAEILKSSNEIFDMTRSIATLDVLTSHALFAARHHYCCPHMDEGRIFDICAGRHPIVEILGDNNQADFIANDCHLSDDYYLWLITGPNMAGKSTFLRQNALIALMAQAGFFVPAQSAHIGLIDKLFSRVGASDNIARGHSTFMVEMLETAAILNRASQQSFVILDEIGRGTATFDGLSLAHAITEYLHHIIKCRTLFATHYHELNDLQQSCSAIQSMHVSVREYDNQIIFTHQLEQGCAERSYGIHVARLAGLPEDILTRADEILGQLESERISMPDKMQKAHFYQTDEREKLKNFSQITQFLQNIEPDTLTPREALDCLYRLKMLRSQK